MDVDGMFEAFRVPFMAEILRNPRVVAVYLHILEAPLASRYSASLVSTLEGRRPVASFCLSARGHRMPFTWRHKRSKMNLEVENSCFSAAVPLLRRWFSMVSHRFPLTFLYGNKVKQA